jgi:hypothetical protein
MTPTRALSIAGGLGGLGAACVPGLALAQRLAQPDAPGIAWWRLIGSLLVCLALAVGAVVVMRLKLKGGAPLLAAESSRLRLVQSLRLSHQVDVCLLECDDLSVLIATSAQGPVVIHTRPAQAEGASA